MTGSNRPRAAALGAALLALGWVATATATVMVEIPLEDLIRQADGVVHGTVVRTGTQMVLRAEGALEPHTLSTVRVRRWLRGTGPDTVTLRELGGVWQGGGMRIDGYPEYRVGEEVIVFVERHPEHPHQLRTHQMAQGKFVVMHGVPGVPSTVQRDLRSVAFARWAEDGQMRIEAANDGPVMQLDGFVDLIQRGGR